MESDALVNKTLEFRDMETLDADTVVIEMRAIPDNFHNNDLLVTATGRLNRSSLEQIKRLSCTISAARRNLI